MTLTLGTKQSFTPAHTPVWSRIYTVSGPVCWGGRRGGGLVWNPEGDPDSTRVHPGPPGCAQAPGGQEGAGSPQGRAQAESWAPPEPPPSPYPGHRQGLWEQGCQSRRARWWPDLAQQQERQMPAEAPQFLEEAPQFGPLTWVPRG